MTQEEMSRAKALSEDIEFGLENIASEKPPNTLRELHTMSLELHSILGGQ